MLKSKYECKELGVENLGACVGSMGYRDSLSGGGGGDIPLRDA